MRAFPRSPSSSHCFSARGSLGKGSCRPPSTPLGPTCSPLPPQPRDPLCALGSSSPGGGYTEAPKVATVTLLLRNKGLHRGLQSATAAQAEPRSGDRDLSGRARGAWGTRKAAVRGGLRVEAGSRG